MPKSPSPTFQKSPILQLFKLKFTKSSANISQISSLQESLTHPMMHSNVGGKTCLHILIHSKPFMHPGVATVNKWQCVYPGCSRVIQMCLLVFPDPSISWRVDIKWYLNGLMYPRVPTVNQCGCICPGYSVISRCVYMFGQHTYSRDIHHSLVERYGWVSLSSCSQDAWSWIYIFH